MKIQLRFLPPTSEGWGRCCFHRCVSVHRGGGYPSPRFFPRSLVPGHFWGVPQSQVLSQLSGPRFFPRGYPSPRFFPSSDSRSFPGGYSSLIWGVPQRGYPWLGLGHPQLGLSTPWLRLNTPWLRLGYPPPKDRTAERVLAMQRVVCLLRSFRSAFLL